MRKSIHIIGFIWLFVCAPMRLCGQTPNETHRMNAMALETIEELELASSLQDKATRYRFKRLFSSDKAEVFCDQYSSPQFLKKISVSSYIDYFAANNENADISFHDIKKIHVVKKGNTWLYVVSLQKRYSYTDANEVLFPVLEDKTPSFDLKITLVLDETLSECKIEKIECTNPQDFSPLNNGYVVAKNDIKKDAQRDEEIQQKGKPLVFNSFNQAYVQNLDFTHPDGDMDIIPEEIEETETYKLVQLRYRMRHGRIRLRNEITPAVYHITTNSQLNKASSIAYTLGIDIGGAFTLSKIAKMGIYSGLAYSYSQLHLEVLNMNYSYPLTNEGGDVYYRCYDLSKASQGARFHDLMVPLYFNFDFSLGEKRIVYLTVDVGAKAYFNTVAKVNPFHIEGDVYGMIGGKRIDDAALNFGTLSGDYNQFITPVSFNRNPVDCSVFGSVGVDVNIYKNFLFLEAKAGYEFGVTQTYQSQQSVFYDDKNGMYPMVYSHSLKQDVVVRPLADCLSFRRQAFTINIGLMIKY